MTKRAHACPSSEAMRWVDGRNDITLYGNVGGPSQIENMGRFLNECCAVHFNLLNNLS